MPRSPPSTQCAPWPYEASAFGHNALTNESAQLIRTHVATLLADSRRAITPLAIEKMFARNQTRKSCVLLRASNGRLLVDPLDTPFLRGNIEIASCYPSKFYNFIRSRMHVAFRLILRAMRRLRLPDFEVGRTPEGCRRPLWVWWQRAQACRAGVGICVAWQSCVGGVD